MSTQNINFNEDTAKKNKDSKERLEKIVLDVNEVAQLLNLSPGTVYTMVRHNELPYQKARGKIIFNKNLIYAWTRGEVPNQNESEKQSQ